jgi:hypothetical protein
MSIQTRCIISSISFEMRTQMNIVPECPKKIKLITQNVYHLTWRIVYLITYSDAIINPNKFRWFYILLNNKIVKNTSNTE